MLLQRPFEVVTTSVDGRLLEVLTGADAWFTIARVWTLSGVRSRDQVRKVLARLAATGLLDVEQVGTSYRYRLNRDHLAAPAVIEIASTRQRFLNRLRDEFLGWKPAATYAALFGSAARGDMKPSSDIDIFVVHPDTIADDSQKGGWGDQVRDLEARIARWTGNPANTLCMSESEVRQAGDVDALYNISREAVPLYGSSSWLKRTLRTSQGANR